MANIQITQEEYKETRSKIGKNLEREIFEKLPECLKFIGEIENQNERHIAFFSSLAGIASCLPNYFFTFLDEIYFSPHYFYVVGEPQTGKGAVRFAEKLTIDVHNYILNDYLQAKKFYAFAPEEEKKNMEKPVLKTLFVSANITGAAFYKAIQAQDICGNLLVATEAVKLQNSLKGEHGGFIGDLCDIYDQTRIDKSLSSDEDHVCKMQPKLSMVLASTPETFSEFLEQLHKTGLLTRIVIFHTENINEALCMKKKNNGKIPIALASAKETIFNIFYLLRSTNLEFVVPEKMEKKFNCFFEKLKNYYVARCPLIKASIVRLMQTSLRQMSVLAILRAFEQGKLRNCPNFILPTQEDYDITCALAKIAAYNYWTTYEHINMAKKKFVNPIEYLKSLDKVFKAAEFQSACLKAGLSGKTAEKKLATLVRLGIISPIKEKRGYYKKNKI